MCIFCILKLQLWTVMANPSRLSSLLLTSWMNLGHTNVLCEDGCGIVQNLTAVSRADEEEKMERSLAT